VTERSAIIIDTVALVSLIIYKSRKLEVMDWTFAWVVCAAAVRDCSYCVQRGIAENHPVNVRCRVWNRGASVINHIITAGGVMNHCTCSGLIAIHPRFNGCIGVYVIGRRIIYGMCLQNVYCLNWNYPVVTSAAALDATIAQHHLLKKPDY